MGKTSASRDPSSIRDISRRKMHLSAARVSYTKTKAKKWNTNATRSSLTMPKLPPTINMPQFPPTISMPQFPVFPALPWQKNDRRDDELVDSLLELVEGSDCGADMSLEKRSQVVDAVEKLMGGGVKKPARSKLLEARYDVVYTDNAVAAGGPFRTAPGRAIFWTDAITQVIEEGNLFNRVDFHLLGLVPGAVTLDAQVDILSDDRLRARFDRPKLELAGKTFEFGKESATEQEVLYLDERIRISRGLSSKASLLIFKKIT